MHKYIYCSDPRALQFESSPLKFILKQPSTLITGFLETTKIKNILRHSIFFMLFTVQCAT